MAIRADDVDLDRDAALVERFQMGDEEAFTDLYRRYFGRVRRYCQRQLGDPHDAEEAAQEALVRAYRALPKFNGDRRFYPWLRVIAANLCADMRRRKPVAALADPERGDVVVESLFEVLDRENVRAALDGLHPRHQTALSLWAEGYASRHIAEELGCSRGAADVTLHRARQSFRRQFLALTGEGKLGAFGALGLGPAVARWAQRWRVRIASRVGEHADLFSPLAAKAVAGAIAFSVVGGGVATANSAPTARPTAPPMAVVHTAPASATPPAPMPGVTSGAYRAVDHQAPPPPPTVPPQAPPPERSLGPARFMTYDQARDQGSKAPIRVEAAGEGVSVDPGAALSNPTGIIAKKGSQ